MGVAYKSSEFISYITSPPWYMSILAVGVDLHFKNHGHPALEIIWLIYLGLSCALLLLLFIKPLRRVQIVMNNRYSFGWGTFILNCGYLFLPLFGQIGVYIGICVWPFEFCFDRVILKISFIRRMKLQSIFELGGLVALLYCD